MNADTLKGQWNQLKGKVREQWGNLTDDDVESVGGNYDKLVGKIQEKYGVGKEKAQKMLDDLKT